MQLCLSRLSIFGLGLSVCLLVDGRSSAWAQVPAPGANKQAAPGNNPFGGIGGAGGGAAPGVGGGMVQGAGGIIIMGGGFGGGAFVPFPFAPGFPGGVMLPNGGVGLLGGVPMGGVRAGGGAVGGGMVGGAGNVRPQQAPRLPTPAAPPKPALVDREIAFDIASDASYSRLQASSAGLNNIDAKFDDIKVGQRLSLSAGKKGGAARPDDVTGTVVAVNEEKRQVTVKVSVPADQQASDFNYIAQTVMIRSQAAGK